MPRPAAVGIGAGTHPHGASLRRHGAPAKPFPSTRLRYRRFSAAWLHWAKCPRNGSIREGNDRFQSKIGRTKVRPIRVAAVRRASYVVRSLAATGCGALSSASISSIVRPRVSIAMKAKAIAPSTYQDAKYANPGTRADIVTPGLT